MRSSPRWARRAPTRNHAPYRVLAAAGKRTDIDLFVHLGDHVYRGAKVDANGDAVPEASSLAQYRAKYREAWSAPGMRALHASVALLTTWDDHEVDNNWNPETISNGRITNARRAFFEHRPFRRDSAAPDRVWRKVKWGRRRPSSSSATRCRSRPGCRARPSRTPARATPRSAPTSSTTSPTGDVHWATIAKVAASGPHSAQREIVMGPGATWPGASRTLPAGQYDVGIFQRDFAMLRADPVEKTLEVSYLGANGVIATRMYTST